MCRARVRHINKSLVLPYYLVYYILDEHSLDSVLSTVSREVCYCRVQSSLERCFVFIVGL